MSDSRKISSPQLSSTQSKRATVVKVIRGTSDAPASSKPKAPPLKPDLKVAQQPVSELDPTRKVVNQSSRTRFRDFSEHSPHQETEPSSGMRVARGPYFPLATSLRFAALFYVLGRLSIVVTIGSLIWLAVTESINYLIIAPSLIAAIVFSFIAWGMSDGLRCRVCTMPFLSKRRCKMNKKAPKLPFVSHHFTVALHILTHNHPRCPYCGTTNRLKQ